ncbi:unnamed protein product [Phaedon cochleariae]|uniref:Uncharacterized protein n=1 Tax=Phaedon cochleariae TaxID=80249 RepID=A0A9P0DSP7_PHACE|nr:unnamed protein product [Phaedon cochleariae]
MNTTLQPVLQPSTQSPSVQSPSKSMHPQGSPMSYTQPSGPMPQNPYPNTNMAHSHANAQQNHFSLSVPSGGYSIPASNHPVASLNQSAAAQKNVSYSSGFLPNVGHAQNQNTIPPVSQSLPANPIGMQQPQQNLQNAPTAQSQNSTSVSTPVVEPSTEKDKPQANGTPEKVLPQAEPQENHVTPAVPIPPVVSSPSTSEVAQTSPPKPPQPPTVLEKPDPPKPPAEVAPPPQTTPDPPTDPKPAPEIPATPAPVVVLPPAEDVLPEPPQETDPLAIDPPPAEENAQSEAEGVVGEVGGAKQSPAKKEGGVATTKGAAVARAAVRKVKAAKVEAKPEPKTPVQKSPNTGKVKRQRMMTQHYQSPLPEIEIIAKISSSRARRSHADDKLIYFYKNEFLAVRNADGGFYLCQAMQNVYKSSSKIKIRWLSQDKADTTGEIYTPDFYDLTDFDCILTSLDLARVDKGKYRLKPAEKERTDSILKRCLAVEKGEIVTPSVSEEHPDGLDLSLYKDEEQLKKKRKAAKRKGRPRSVSPKKAAPTKKSPEAAKVRKVEPRAPAPAKKPAPVVRKPAPVASKPAAAEAKKTAGRAARGKRKVESKSPVMDQKKAIVLAKIGRSTAGQAGASRSHSKSAKSSKPVPSTSKSATKGGAAATSSAKATSLRKTKRSTRK